MGRGGYELTSDDVGAQPVARTSQSHAAIGVGQGAVDQSESPDAFLFSPLNNHDRVRLLRGHSVDGGWEGITRNRGEGSEYVERQGEGKGGDGLDIALMSEVALRSQENMLSLQEQLRREQRATSVSGSGSGGGGSGVY